MQTPTLNGVLKPADVIAKGPHVFNEATRKYEERSPTSPQPYPREMYHPDLDAVEATSNEHQSQLEAQGYRTTAFPAKPAKEPVSAVPVDYAALILSQQQQMLAMQQQIAALTPKPEEKKKSA